MVQKGHGGEQVLARKKARFIQELLKMLARLSKSQERFLASGRLGRGGNRTSGMDAFTYRMLLGNERYQVGSMSAFMYRVLLGTERYEVGRHRCFHVSGAARNRTLLSWQA